MTDLDDSEIDAICAGLTQNAAKVRYLRRMGLTVRQKPNGKPLVNRAHFDMVCGEHEPVFEMDDSMWAGGREPFAETALARWQAARREGAEERRAYLDSLPAPSPEEILARKQQAALARAALVRFHAARRRVVKLQRTPSWADQAQILGVYQQAKALTESTGMQHHVDHIIPLQGERVSGLHVQGNLQVIPWRENILKRNHFELDA